MDATSSSPRHTSEEPPFLLRSLHFSDLNQLLDQYLNGIDGAKPGKWERYSLILGIGGAGFGLLLGTTLNGVAGAVAAYGGLFIETIGLLTYAGLQIRRDWHQFRHARAHHASELESGYQQYQHLVKLTRSFPLAERKRRLRYIQDRRNTMHDRLSLFTGGMERLGVIPLLLALYLQFKDWRWADWKAISNITFAQGLLAFILMLAYLLFWHLIHLRARIQAYELLLTESNKRDDEEGRG
ncbi:hypothetical protein ATCM_14005 [Stenotrophomonas sp. ATCM1_4]|uniref:hypothetical protein n=1 Tax=Stenotrophomonas sp. ATCM1_4 TaxID=2259330 RepID=UPI0010471FB3|nr:hypothetical protein [Stenotrophomonas sp. ATCM1_4]TDB28660.1 hypothetical protein ATCM_14005 [Stenotrophomonas sp. ATCM1_4]